MAEKPEQPGLQNVVVYVSNDNFAQAYTTTQHHHQVSAPPQHLQHNLQNGGATGVSPEYAPQSSKSVKQAASLLKHDYPNNTACFYGTDVYQQLNNFNFNRNAVAPPGVRSEYQCDIDGSNYVTVCGTGGENAQLMRNCDSVRSETAESSCSSSSSQSSGSSTDDAAGNIVHPSNGMLLYENAANSLTAQPGAFVTVPFGWKRILNNNTGTIIYISPSNAVLTCQEQIKEYLLSSGTCKCGLECHFKYDNVFNFDPKVISRPWNFQNNNNLDAQSIGDSKLCNHKRKFLATMASALDYKPQQQQQQQIEPNLKMIKDYNNVKRKKRRIDGMMTYGNIDVDGIPTPQPQILHRAEIPNANFLKEASNNNNNINNSASTGGPNVWNNQPQQHPFPVAPQQRNYPDIQAQYPPYHNPNILIHNQQIIGPNGQIIHKSGNGNNLYQPPVLPQKFQQSQRVYVNQPNEPSGPGRPAFFNNSNAQRPLYGFKQQQQQQQQMMLNNYATPPRMWQHHRNVYERVPPLHPGHAPPWGTAPQDDEIVKKKRGGKKNRAVYNIPPQCPNIDVRQLQLQQPQPAPSFMEDPSGYLAQQTALLNNTINPTPPRISEIPRTNGVKNAYTPDSSGCETPNSVDDNVSSSSNFQINDDTRPIQGGTVSTSDGLHSGPPTPQTTPPYMVQRISETNNYVVVSNGQKLEYFEQQQQQPAQFKVSGVTTMAPSRTCGSNTITSVQAGRANTATVAAPPPKSPLEMVQSVVSSIVPNSVSKPQTGHILMSSNGQLIMTAAPTNNTQMPPPPPPPKVMIPQQMLGQQTVLVNTLPPFVLQPMTMDTTQLVTTIQQNEPKKQKTTSGKKRKQQQEIPVFPSAAPVMQALTILPGKNGGVSPGGFVMNSPNSLNLLQPVNLINPNYQTIQQFIVPNLSTATGMVMNPDGTATILQDANIGMQLQLSNVNGQNILTQNLIPGNLVIRGGGAPKLNSPNAPFQQYITPIVAPPTPNQQPPQFQTLMMHNPNNATYVQQNTTIVQQQTTMVSAPQPPGYRHQSVSTQTAAQTSQLVTTNASPPDTTTLSPIGGQSPATVDTTAPDDGLSPLGTFEPRQNAQGMAMVHCISSSEPDQTDSTECFRVKQQFNEISSGQLGYYRKSNVVVPVAPQYSETNLMHFNSSAVGGGATRHFDKRKSTGSVDTMLIMETSTCAATSHYDEEEKTSEKSNSNSSCSRTVFIIGDLIWAPTKTCPAWPGKIIELNEETASVKWFGCEKSTNVIPINKLQTLSEGLEAHHRARKQIRTSRKLNSQLENAIQEAMRELDKFSETKLSNVSSTKSTPLGRLRNRN